ncbi:MAG: SurA N-terminal domain-containing protein [Bacteroidota bacterium]
MATLQKLRNKFGVLLAVIIGLSLLAFILGDFLSSGSAFFQRGRYEVAEINGKAINYPEYSTRVEQSIENYKKNSGVTALDEGTLVTIRNQVWNSYLNEYVFADEYKKLGVDCPPLEVFDMVQGKNIHPQIQQAQRFQNQQTGGFDRNLVLQFLKSLDQDATGQSKEMWVQFEQELMKDRIYTKYNNLISKGMYVTRKMVDTELGETERKYNFSYVPLRYATTSDSLVKITDAEVEKYYGENLDKFKQEASRDLAYVTFDRIPSQADRDEVYRWINEVKPEFERIENVGQFIGATAESGFNESYYGLLDIPDTLRTWAMMAPVGAVYGPYLEERTWKLARITGIKDLPDSVRASHILIRPVNNSDFDAAQVTADSILRVIRQGQDFGFMAAKYGTDGSKDKGGDLGWFIQGDMDADFAKACFFGNKGDLLTVRTRYGVHVINITDQGPKSKKVQIGILDRTITPSDKTDSDIYSQASRFASTYGTSDKFDEGIQKENLNKRLATNLHAGDAAITGLENPRQMIQWAFNEAEKGDVSGEIYEFGDRYVIARLIEVREEGTAPLEQVRAQVENSVRNEKKAIYLIAEATKVLQGTNSLDVLASKFNSSVNQVTNAYFTSYTITGIGMEPQVSAAMITTPVNQVSKPIKGTNGVYVIMVTSVTEPSSSADRLASRQRLEQEFSSRAGYEVFAALEKTAKIKDNRNKFY